MKKYILIDSSGASETAYHVIRSDNGKRELIFTGDRESEAHEKILEDAEIKIEDWPIDDFIKKFCEGFFNPITSRLCSDCGKEHSANCPLRVWGRNEKNEGQCIGTKPSDFCSHFEEKSE